MKRIELNNQNGTFRFRVANAGYDVDSAPPANCNFDWTTSATVSRYAAGIAKAASFVQMQPDFPVPSGNIAGITYRARIPLDRTFTRQPMIFLDRGEPAAGPPFVSSTGYWYLMRTNGTGINQEGGYWGCMARMNGPNLDIWQRWTTGAGAKSIRKDIHYTVLWR